MAKFAKVYDDPKAAESVPLGEKERVFEVDGIGAKKLYVVEKNANGALATAARFSNVKVAAITAKNSPNKVGKLLKQVDKLTPEETAALRAKLGMN
jgi:hypothetical protein